MKIKSNTMPTPCKAVEGGNVMFLIFIGIMLFAGLSYSVTQIMRSGTGSDISDEKARLYAAELLDTARQFKQAIKNAAISDDCEDVEISFANPTITGYEHTPAASEACQIFHGSFGTATYRTPATDWLDETRAALTGYGHWLFTGEGCVHNLGTGGTDCASANGTTDSELIAVMPYVHKRVCTEVNKLLGITNPGDEPPQSATPALNTAMTKFTGSYGQNFAIQSNVSDTEILNAAPAGCFEGAGAPIPDTYHFYQVLIVR